MERRRGVRFRTTVDFCFFFSEETRELKNAVCDLDSGYENDKKVWERCWYLPAVLRNVSKKWTWKEQND